MIRILKIEEPGIPGQPPGLIMLPGSFNTTREAYASIRETGEYLFLESHQVETPGTLVE